VTLRKTAHVILDNVQSISVRGTERSINGRTAATKTGSCTSQSCIDSHSVEFAHVQFHTLLATTNITPTNNAFPLWKLVPDYCLHARVNVRNGLSALLPTYKSPSIQKFTS